MSAHSSSSTNKRNRVTKESTLLPSLLGRLCSALHVEISLWLYFAEVAALARCHSQLNNILSLDLTRSTGFSKTLTMRRVWHESSAWFRCAGDLLRRLFASLHALQSVTLPAYHSDGLDVIHALLRHVLSSSSTSLRRLRMEHVEDARDLVDLFRECRRLDTLEMHLQPHCATQLARMEPLPSLHQLTLFAVKPTVSRSTLTTFLKNCPALTQLNIYAEWTSIQIPVIAKTLDRLRVFCLYSVSPLAINLSPLASLPLLEELELRACWTRVLIVDAVLPTATSSCIDGVPPVSFPTLTKLRTYAATYERRAPSSSADSSADDPVGSGTPRLPVFPKLTSWQFIGPVDALSSFYDWAPNLAEIDLDVNDTSVHARQFPNVDDIGWRTELVGKILRLLNVVVRETGGTPRRLVQLRRLTINQMRALDSVATLKERVQSCVRQIAQQRPQVVCTFVD